MNYVIHNMNRESLLQKRKLAGKKVEVLDEWIEACIQWLSSENQNSNLTPDQLHNLIYEQWLMSDLREVAEPSFPSNIGSNLQTHFLKGTYSVQVNYGLNISASAFSQLQNIKGCSIDDPTGTENEKDVQKSASSSTRNYGAKGSKISRTLLLELSDGYQTVKAFEYISIPSLPDNITPGLKVQLKGSIPCRGGFLLISPNNISILGGNAEDLGPEFNISDILDKIVSGSGSVTKKEVKSTTSKVKKEDIPKAKKTARLKKEERKEVDLDSFFEEDFPVNEDFSEEALLACSDNADNEIPLTMSNVDESGGEVLKEERGSKLSNSTRFGERKEKKEFEFLREFLEDSSLREIVVKAYIVTLLSKLDVQETSCKLSVCIDDGSAVTSCNIASHVLEELLGVSPSELLVFRDKPGPIPDTLKMAILQCQQRLGTSLWRMKLIKKDSDSSIEIDDMKDVFS